MMRTPLPFAHTVGTPTEGSLVDTFGRVHDNLRVSVTDRCNMRCVYCMPEDVEFLPSDELLRFDEIERFVRVAISLGVTKVRLTGGEPLLRPNLTELVARLAVMPGLHDLGLTTNGMLLERHAAPLYRAGLRRLNVSLDTLDDAHFRILSRRNGLQQMLAGLEAAKRAGFDPIKVNAVAIRGFIEQDAPALAKYCRANGLELRFIEYMPIGAEAWDRRQVVTAAELRTILAAEVGELIPTPRKDLRAPAEDWDYADGGGRVGFIASVSEPFCGDCNRLRITAEGKLRNCLFSTEETDVRGLSDSATADVIRACVWGKTAGHGFNAAGFVKPERTMHAIGG